MAESAEHAERNGPRAPRPPGQNSPPDKDSLSGEHTRNRALDAGAVRAGSAGRTATALSITWTAGDAPEHPVVATGAFDILHVGHLRLLSEAHRRGRPFIVGVESDDRIRAWKGPTRPINPEHDRAAMLAALRYVDGCFIISGDPAAADWREYCGLLAPLEPSALVFTVGDPHADPKKRAAEALGADAWEVAHVPKRSTTRIAGRMRLR